MQFAAVVLGALVAWVASDWTSARFFLLGGAAAVIPNALFALRLAVHRGKRPESYPAVFFLGELVKIALTVALFAAVVRFLSDVRWLPALLGLIVALKAPLFAPLLSSPAVPADADDGGKDRDTRSPTI